MDRTKDGIDNAYLLVIRKGVTAFVESQSLKVELDALSWDTKAKMYGRVVNKKKRHNLCFADYAQEPNYELGKGCVVDFKKLPLLSSVRKGLVNSVGKGADGLLAEGNLYYDASTCGIGFHGDTERRKVIGLRLGEDMPLIYRWFKS